VFEGVETRSVGVEEARQACAVCCDLARCVGPPKLKRIFGAHLCHQEHVRGPASASAISTLGKWIDEAAKAAGK